MTLSEQLDAIEARHSPYVYEDNGVEGKLCSACDDGHPEPVPWPCDAARLVKALRIGMEHRLVVSGWVPGGSGCTGCDWKPGALDHAAHVLELQADALLADPPTY